MSLAAVYLLLFFTASTCIFIAQADAPSKGDRGNAVTSNSVSSTGSRDLTREATGYERPAYGTQTFYPPSGNNKGGSRTVSSGYQGQRQGNQKGYPVHGGNSGYGGYGSQGVYEPQNRGGYVANQPSYGNNKGWSSSNSGWGGNTAGGNYGGSWSPSYGNYKGSSGGNRGWYGGQSGYESGWYGGSQMRPSSGGYNWPQSSGYRGEKGYSGSYGGNNWGYGNQGSGYGNQGNGYGGGYINQGTNKGLGNQIYGSGYGGAGQRGWINPSYGNQIPNQGGYNTWDNYGYQGYNKGGSSPRLNAVDSNRWSDTRSGYGNYPNNKGWW